MVIFLFYLICPNAWTYFSSTSRYLLAFSLTARHPQLYSITYILFHIKKSDITWKEKKETAHFKPSGKPPLAGCQASAKSSSLFWACSLETNRMLLWQHGRQPRSMYSHSVCSVTKPHTTREAKGKRYLTFFKKKKRQSTFLFQIKNTEFSCVVQTDEETSVYRQIQSSKT